MVKKGVSYLRSIFSKLDKNILTYLICILIAGCLWALNSLNKEYTTLISYPIKYTDLPKNRFLVNDPPETLSLEVRATGFILLRHQIRHSFLPITFSLNSYLSTNTTQNTFTYILKLNDIRDKISAQLSSSIRLLNIKPEEITLHFSEAISKTVKVEPQVKYTLRKGYILKDNIRSTPDSVTISGPASIIDSIDKIYTEAWQAGEIRRSKSGNIKLLIPKKINLHSTDVDINIEAERFTEGKKTLPVYAENIPEGLQIRLFPSNIDITYEVGLSKYSLVKDNDFRLVAEYIENSSHLQVQVETAPAFIQNIKFTPQKVEFILEKNTPF